MNDRRRRLSDAVPNLVQQSEYLLFIQDSWNYSSVKETVAPACLCFLIPSVVTKFDAAWHIRATISTTILHRQLTTELVRVVRD